MRSDSSPGVEELRQFDAAILTTGGKVAWPAIPGIDSSRVCTFEDVLRCKVEGCTTKSSFSLRAAKILALAPTVEQASGRQRRRPCRLKARATSDVQGVCGHAAL